MNRVCVYSCNFGKYRGETKSIDKVSLKENVDYYLYTDDTSLKSTKWKIIHCDLKPGDKNMNSYRRTSKYIKFVTPDIITRYDIIIWCDTKCLHRLNTLNLTAISSLFESSEYKLVNLFHPGRKTLQDELNATLRIRLENKTNGELFLNEIKQLKYDTILPDTSFIIRKNDTATNEMFKHVYTLLEKKGLNRDQNIYNHAIYECKYPAKHIYMIRDSSTLKP
jgi:hypothetical protein